MTGAQTTAITHLRALLKSCKNTKHLKATHAHILKHHHPFSHDLLLSSYSHSPAADFSYAATLFSLLPAPAVFHWNSLIRGLSATNTPSPLSLYRSMLRNHTLPNNFTFPFLIRACSSARHAAVLHAHVLILGLDPDPYIQSTLIHIYATAVDADGKDLVSARKVFDSCSDCQTVCWNSMLDGYVKCGKLDLARSIFDRMECRDIISWNTMINGYSLMGNATKARDLFDRMPHRNVVSWNSMLAGYTKCGDVERAVEIFQSMPRHDVVSWNTMLACYVQSGCSDEALSLFDEMQHAAVKPTDATFVSLLSACAHLGELGRGEKFHQFIKDLKIELNTILATALVDMYAKCGRILQATEIFEAIEHKDALAWNAIIAGMAVHGRAEEALQLLSRMMGSGCRPDDITFVGLLSACSHAGMVREGRRLLDCMKETYGVKPKIEHYGCVIDLLARKGLLDEAVKLMEAMPMKPNAPALGALLGGCRIYENAEVAHGAGKYLLDLQPNHSGRYILLSNIYATKNRWEDVNRVRSMMVAKGVAKVPGMSMVELDGTINQFVAGDRSHPESEDVYKKLSEILELLKVEAGYCPDTRQVLLDIEEEEKEHMMLVHSEKLAIAFGLLHTTSGATIRIIKNLRVCTDCHNVMKLISRLYCREIVMRDRNRFHLYKDGVCSCMDYW